MNAILLTRQSEFQIYCANSLWRQRRITAVVVEKGFSFHRGVGIGTAARAVRRNAATIVPVMVRSPRTIADYATLVLRKESYFGSQERHHRRLLQADYGSFAQDLPVYEVPDINSPQVPSVLQQLTPDIVLVFGTALIRPQLFGVFPVPWVNLHWGWSPTYRGEGIVSALAREGPEALGVTVHLLSARSDAGHILHRARPTVDAEDNFYSIGLKLTRLGLDLFVRTLDDFGQSGHLDGEPQDLSRGRVYTTKYMKTHPHLCHQAWANLKRAVLQGSEKRRA